MGVLGESPIVSTQTGALRVGTGIPAKSARQTPRWVLGQEHQLPAQRVWRERALEAFRGQIFSPLLVLPLALGCVRIAVDLSLVAQGQTSATHG